MQQSAEIEVYRSLATDLMQVARVAFPRAVSDVVLWTAPHGYERIAFVGHAERMAKMFGMAEVGGQADPRIGRRIALALASIGVRLHDSDWDGGSSLAEVLERLTGQSIWQWARSRGVELPDDGVRVGFIPEPGYPWPTKDGTYWSVKNGEQASDKPAWLIRVEDPMTNEMRWGINPCSVFPPDESRTEPGGPVCGDLDGLKVMVTHSMALGSDAATAGYREWTLAARNVRECGGLLFPSLAVGEIPATNFGPVVFVGRLELLLASLRPYMVSGRRPCWVYGSDAWTIRTGSAMREMAASLFDELHGDDDWIYSHTMSVLGVEPTSKTPTEWMDPIQSTRELRADLAKLAKLWKRSMTAADFARMNATVAGKDMYAYAEAKAREVVSMSEFPFIVTPKYMLDVVEKFAQSIGYDGEIVVLPAVKHMDSTDDRRGHALYQWAWKVSDAVRKLLPIAKVST